MKRVSDMMVGWISNGTTTAPTLNHETALQAGSVLSAVRCISEGVASAPIRLIEQTKANGLARTRTADDHALHKLLQRPNDFQTSFEFIEGMVANAVLGKGALAIKVQVGNEVRELLPVMSGVWTQEQLTDGSSRFLVNMADGSQAVFTNKQVLFFRGLSLDGYSSVSSIEAARTAVGIANSLESQTLRSASSGGRPSGVLSFPEGMSPETKEKLRTQWQQRYSAGGEGGIAVLDGAASFTPMAQSATDLQVIENRRFQVQEIARIFRVHPAFLMDSTSQINSDLMRWHVSNTLLPWMKRFEQALNRDLIGHTSNKLHFDFDEMDLLRGDHAAFGAFAQIALGNGGHQAFMTTNEVRQELGLDGIDETWARNLSPGGYLISGGANGVPDQTD